MEEFVGRRKKSDEIIKADRSTVKLIQGYSQNAEESHDDQSLTEKGNFSRRKLGDRFRSAVTRGWPSKTA